MTFLCRLLALLGLHPARCEPPPPPPPPVPTLELTLYDSADGLRTLGWEAHDAASCTASGAWSGTRPTKGYEDIAPDALAWYGLRCDGAGGTVYVERAAGPPCSSDIHDFPPLEFGRRYLLQAPCGDFRPMRLVAMTLTGPEGEGGAIAPAALGGWTVVKELP